MELIRFNSYLHGYTIPGLHQDLIQYKEEIVDLYNNTTLPPTQANFIFSNNEFQSKYQKLLLDIVNQNYVIEGTWKKNNLAIYVQDNKTPLLSQHSHINTDTINAVFYIDPPLNNEGGEFEFWYKNGFEKISPERDIIYFFPAWLVHRPLPQTSPIPRVAINWGYGCFNRPINKLTGDIW